MAISVEGFGADWIVTRKPGGVPELTTFRSPEELQALVKRLLGEADEQEIQRETPRPTPPPTTSRLGRRLPRKTASPVAAPAPPPAAPVPDLDCTRCGACCAPPDPQATFHVRIDEDDVRSLPPAQQHHLIVKHKGLTYLGTKKTSQGTTVCRAYKGQIGHQGTCMIYDHRPTVCRVFEPGATECLSARKRFGADGGAT